MKVSPIIKNFSFLTISNIVGQLMAIFSSIKIAKLLLPSGYGVFSYIFSLASIYFVIVSLGLRNIVIRDLAIEKIKPKGLFFNLILIKSLPYVFTIGIVFVYNYYSNLKLSEFLIMNLLVNVFLLMIYDTVEAITFGYERMRFSAYANVIGSFIWLVSILLLPNRYFSLETIILLTNINQIMKIGILLVTARTSKTINFDISIRIEEMKYLIKGALPFYILAVFTLFTSQLPVLYLERFSTKTEIAFFNVSNKIIAPFQMLLLTLLTSLFPNISRSYLENQDKFKKTISIVLLVICILGILGSLFISFFRSEIIHLLYGKSYEGVADVIAIQCWFTVLFGIFCLIGTILGAINKQVLLSKLSICYAVISIPFLVYGATYGALGLSIGFIIAGIVNLSYHVYFIFKSIPNVVNLRSVLLFFIVYGVSISLSIFIGGFSFISKSLIFFALLISISVIVYLKKKMILQYLNLKTKLA